MKVPIAELQAAILAHQGEEIEVVDDGGRVVAVVVDPAWHLAGTCAIAGYGSLNEIRLEVRNMREHQRAYFKRRESADLIAAKRCEGEVDRLLREIDSPQSRLL